MISTYLQALPHGITLSCRATGQRGQPVLLFLHGFPEAAFVWDELLEHFAARGYRCVAPNLRGFEQSSAPADVSAYRPKHLVQDIAALIAVESPHAPLACLVAHDWGGAVAWNLANQQPQLSRRLAIINSPHPGTFLRELQNNTKQQAASAYMNFLVRPDAEALLAENDFARMWPFFSKGHGQAPAWLTEAVRDQYRAVWRAGLTGGCNYYRASPLHPDTPDAPGRMAAVAAKLNPADFQVRVRTQVIWGTGDAALRPVLLDGLAQHVSDLRIHRIEGADHWLNRRHADEVNQVIRSFLSGTR